LHKKYVANISPLEMLYYKLKYWRVKFSAGDTLEFVDENTCQFATCSSKVHHYSWRTAENSILVSPFSDEKNFPFPERVYVSPGKIVAITERSGVTWVRVFH
jgi:hypothetical protein